MGSQLGSLFGTGQSNGATGTGGGWSPTITYLIVLVIAEMIVFGFIAKSLR